MDPDNLNMGNHPTRDRAYLLGKHQIQGLFLQDRADRVYPQEKDLIQGIFLVDLKCNSHLKPHLHSSMHLRCSRHSSFLGL